MEQLLRATARAEARHFWFRGFRRFVTPMLRTVARERPGRLSALDCGCGTGANVDLLSQFGHAWGFDLTMAGLRIGREFGRRRLAQGSVIAAPFPGSAFDLVTSFDVLYALDDAEERAAVLEMYRLLRPGGYGLVNVAATPALRGDHSVLSHEKRRYTRASLRRLLEGAGFEIVRLTYTNATLFVPMLLVRTLHRWRGLASEADAEVEIRVPPAVINGPLTVLLALEGAWLRWFNAPFGSSLLCLARKPDRQPFRKTSLTPQTPG